MRRWMLFFAVGICVALLGGSVSGYAANCTVEAKALQAAADDLTKALAVHNKSMVALAQATKDLLAAQKDHVAVSAQDTQALSDDATAGRNWVDCKQSPNKRNCDSEKQKWLSADQGVAKTKSDLARAKERMLAAQKAAQDAGKTEQADLKKKDDARAAYKAARDRSIKCIQQLPKKPAPAQTSPKTP